jgi:integrase
MYGCGLRLGEVAALRVKDIDFDEKKLYVRRGKGGKDRILPLPDKISGDLKAHLHRVRNLFSQDSREGFDGVFMPDDVGFKNKSSAKEFAWYWLFPARSLTRVVEDDELRRYHLHETNIQKAIKEAARKTDIAKRVAPQGGMGQCIPLRIAVPR